MEVTFRPTERGIFKQFPPECQKNRRYVDDDLPSCRDILVGRNGEVRHACQCLSWENVQCVQLCPAMPNHSIFAVTAHLQLIILLTAGPSRGQEVNYAPILVNILLFMYKSDPIVALLVIVMFLSRLAKCYTIYNSACVHCQPSPILLVGF